MGRAGVLREITEAAGLTTVLPSQLLASDRTERTIEVNLVVAQQRHEDGSLIWDKKGKGISWTT